MAETSRRREKQEAYNAAHGITPRTITKSVDDILNGLDSAYVTAKIDKKQGGGKDNNIGGNLTAHLDHLRATMIKAAENLEFEEAARLRDEIKRLETVDLLVADDPMARQSAIDEAVTSASQAEGRSSAGRPGQRGGNHKRRGRKNA